MCFGKITQFCFDYLKYLNDDKDDDRGWVLGSFNKFLTDLSFLITWYGIYKSTKVLLLLNK